VRRLQAQPLAAKFSRRSPMPPPQTASAKKSVSRISSASSASNSAHHCSYLARRVLNARVCSVRAFSVASRSIDEAP
jgi:hypothetical protein